MKKLLALLLALVMVLSMAACAPADTGSSNPDTTGSNGETTPPDPVTITLYPLNANLTSGTVGGWLGEFLPLLGEDDLLMITADHGCDPGYTATTDHTREYVPLLILGHAVEPGNLGTRESFADIAATVTDLLGVSYQTPGKSFANDILKG